MVASWPALAQRAAPGGGAAEPARQNSRRTWASDQGMLPSGHRQGDVRFERRPRGLGAWRRRGAGAEPGRVMSPFAARVSRHARAVPPTVALAALGAAALTAIAVV